MLYGLPLVSGITLALTVGADSDARAAMFFFVGLLGAFAVLRWMTSRSLFGAVEPQLERIVEFTADEGIVHIQSS
jgi:hypothetical protein